MNVFKRMVPRIDGFWLLPDNRVLSPSVLRGMMSYGAKHKRQIVVFNDKLLPLGALMSVSSDPDDVAEQVARLLDHAGAGGTPVVAPLTRINVRINPAVADELGLIVPEPFTRRARESED